jgi:hypothetical protein
MNQYHLQYYITYDYTVLSLIVTELINIQDGAIG